MALEVEARILEVDVAALVARLESTGALKYEDALFREVLWHLRPGDLTEYVRVRHDGHHVLITHKMGVDGMSAQETEFGADDYDAAVALFDRLGLERAMCREKHRTSFRLQDVAISIDRYPGIPALAEVEAGDPAAVEQACIVLGLKFGAHFPGGLPAVYRHYGRELLPGAVIAFSDDERRAILEELGLAAIMR